MTPPSNAAPNLASVVPLTTESPQAKTSVEELCRKRYRFHHPGLLLSIDEKGEKVTIKANAANYRIILANLPGLDLSYSVFEQTELINNQPLTDLDILEVRDKLIHMLGANLAKQDVADAVELTAHARKFNPLEAWFRNLAPSEAKGHLDRWLFDVCGTPQTEINRILGRKWLISAVARAMKPGCYVEGSLIFYGSQGIGKSWLFRNLNPRPEYYCGEELNVSNKKEAAAVCAGKFIIELAELNSIRRNELNAMKQYLTEQSDTYQPKYKQKAITVPRMHIFGGSTNEETFLTDTTGNRRFWCVATGEEIKQELFLKIKNELWAEALAAFDAGEQWTLTKGERELLEEANRQFQVEEPLQEFLREALNGLWPDQFMSTNMLMQTVLKDYREKVHPKALASAMRGLGWAPGQKKSDGGVIRGYNRPMNQEWGEEPEA